MPQARLGAHLALKFSLFAWVSLLGAGAGAGKFQRVRVWVRVRVNEIGHTHTRRCGPVRVNEIGRTHTRTHSPLCGPDRIEKIMPEQGVREGRPSCGEGDGGYNITCRR
jgi:hypothetical protein